MNTLADANPVARARLQAESFPGVKSVTPVYLGRVDWRQPDGTLRALDVLGFEPAAIPLRPPEIRQQQGALTQADTVLLDSRTRNIDAARVLAANQRDAHGIRSASADHQGRGPLRDRRRLLRRRLHAGVRSDLHEAVPSRSGGAPTLGLIRLEPGADAAAVVRSLRQHFGDADDVKVRTLAEAVAASDSRPRSGPWG